MPTTVRSFSKINLGLRIGGFREDGFHRLLTVYQTIALHDVVRVRVERGAGIEIRCDDPRVPKDESNTCYRMIERALTVLNAKGRVVIEIEKRLPVQGGLGGASGNGVAALLALERSLKKELPEPEKLRIASEVGSDIPLFLVGGTVLGAGRGEEVYPLPDLPAMPCVIAMPGIAVSTPKAFRDWDESSDPKLTVGSASDRMLEFSRAVCAWLSAQSNAKSGKGLSGVPAVRRGRAETPLLDLVRTGIENDFEQVVFPKYPELREVKRVLERAGAFYASLSGSGSAVYGLFRTQASAENAAARLVKLGTAAQATMTLTRRQYWKKFLVSSF